MEILVSVIITAKKEEANIRHCLDSIKNQNLLEKEIEIIVVDNNSNDRTKEIVSEYTEKIYNFGPERSAQRNFGIRQARGKYVIYLDADMALSPKLISECLEKCEREGCIGLYIPERIKGKGFWIKVRDFERSFYNATVIDCVRFMRRDKFLEIGGFDEGLTGPEDWDLDRRIRRVGNTGIINSPIYHNEGGFNLGKYLGKKSYYARDFQKYIAKWGQGDPVVKRQLGFCYRYFGVFIENGKWIRLISHPLLALGMYALRFMVGFSYLISKTKNKWTD